MSLWITSLRAFLSLTILSGVIYPLAVLLIAQTSMYELANGSILQLNGKKIGSSLIGQEFSSAKYFGGRPSLNRYDALASGGTNWGWTDLRLKKQSGEKKGVPSNLLYSSASGLDPHITPEAAAYQIDRILNARGIDPEKGKKRLREMIEKEVSLIGPPHVNVLRLNILLDEEKW